MTDYVYYILGVIGACIAYLWKRTDNLYRVLNNHLSEIKASIREIKVDIEWLKEEK